MPTRRGLDKGGMGEDSCGGLSPSSRTEYPPPSPKYTAQHGEKLACHFKFRGTNYPSLPTRINVHFFLKKSSTLLLKPFPITYSGSSPPSPNLIHYHTHMRGKVGCCLLHRSPLFLLHLILARPHIFWSSFLPPFYRLHGWL